MRKLTVVCARARRVCVITPPCRFIYNTYVFNTSLGTSFVGFGSACFYAVNTLATAIASRMAARHGQRPTMLLATLVQVAFFGLMLWYEVKPLQCLPSGCAPGTSGSCWQPGNASNATAGTATSFPIGCRHGAGACATCAAYQAAGGHACAEGWTQCDWLRGDAEPPASADVALMLVAVGLFAIGDSVWESQVPAVLQTLFDEASTKQPAAMANIKLWQSLGIGAMFGLARLNDVATCVLICLVCLVLSSASLLWLDVRVADLDSGAVYADRAGRAAAARRANGGEA